MSRLCVRTCLVAAFGAVALLATGCESKREDPAEAAAYPDGITPRVAKEAEKIFAGRCAPCHGADGKGDGPAAGALKPKPASFRDGDWQQSVTDEQIEKIIAEGGAAVGKNPAMPPNPDLAGKPVVKALRQLIRKMAP